MYLLELFINEDHALASKNVKDDKKTIILFEKIINLKLPDATIAKYPLGNKIDLAVVKESLRFFKSKKDAEKWAKEFAREYEEDIEKDEDGNEKFSFVITKLL